MEKNEIFVSMFAATYKHNDSFGFAKNQTELKIAEKNAMNWEFLNGIKDLVLTLNVSNIISANN